MTLQKDLMIANAIMLQAINAIDEVMGSNGLNTVLRSSGLEKFIDNLPPNDLEAAVPSSDYAQLNSAIEEFYGRGGRGILKRIGRASFQYGAREQPALMGIAGVALKLMPRRKKVTFILNSIGSAIKKTNPENEFFVDDRGDHPAYCVPTCSICFGREAQAPICHLLVGSLTEAVEWATGEKLTVRETLCMAKEDAYCRFEVDLSK
jgi:bacteriochlorophyll 4-vinyl reductase